MGDTVVMRNYRLPDGVEIVSHEDDVIQLRMSVPDDDAGQIGRRCPSCERMFRVDVEDYKSLPEDQQLTCPYCCLVHDNGDFLTQQQQARATAAIGELGRQMAIDAIGSAFQNMARQVNKPGSMIRLDVSTPSGREQVRPLPDIVEEAPIRIRSCATCHLRYAVFGAHIACPLCGVLPPLVVALDALDAQGVVLTHLETLPPEVLNPLREAGAIDRAAGDTLGTVVSVVETFLKGTFAVRVVGAVALTAGKGNIFQRLPDAAQLFATHAVGDLPAILGPDRWDQLRELYARRHVLTHNNGVVDQKFLAACPRTNLVLGQRVNVSLVDGRAALQLGRDLIVGV